MIGEIYRNSDSSLNNSKFDITTNSNNEEALNHLTEKLKQHIPDSTPNRDSVISDGKDKILKRISNSNIVNQNTFKYSTRTLNSTALDEALNSNNVKNLIKEQLRSELNKDSTEVQIIQRISNLKSITSNYLNTLIDSYLNSQMSNFSGQIMNIVSDNMNVASSLQDFSEAETLSTGLENALLTNLKSNFTSISSSLLPSNLLNTISSAYSISIDSNKANTLSSINSNIKGNVRSVTEFATYTISSSILPERTTVDGNITTNDISSNLNNKSTTSVNSGKRNSTSLALESFGKAFGTALLAGAAIKTLSNAFSSISNKGGANIPGSNLGNSNPAPSSSSPIDTTTNGMNNSTSNERQSQSDQQKQDSKSTSNTTENRNNNQDNSSTNNSNENNMPPTETYDNSIPPRAKVKNDPRRDNCQELVLWETDKEKYVLLRDGKGNYILLDEDSGLVRIQHTSGSYIQLTSNIDIEAAGKVNINCAGPSYKKQF